MTDRPVNILYAEDDPEDQEMFSELVEQIGRPVEPHVFNSGLQLVQHLEALDKDHLPDCIVLDIKMPVWDGIRTLTTIRKNHRYDEIPVFMFTTSSETTERVYCLRLGANAFPTKPDDQKEYPKLAGELAHFLS